MAPASSRGGRNRGQAGCQGAQAHNGTLSEELRQLLLRRLRKLHALLRALLRAHPWHQRRPLLWLRPALCQPAGRRGLVVPRRGSLGVVEGLDVAAVELVPEAQLLSVLTTPGGGGTDSGAARLSVGAACAQGPHAAAVRLMLEAQDPWAGAAPAV